MQTLVDRFVGRRIAVIGDVMLDCYLSGDVRRISPEAPVPVIRVVGERSVPGGAANVAANLASLGVEVWLVGLAGEDEARNELIERLEATGGVDCRGVLAEPGRRTTRKLRIIGAHQQIVRVDYEDAITNEALIECRLLEAIERAVDAAELVVISDYGKGVCSPRVLRAAIDRAATAGKPVVVDPKRRDLSVYSGATLLTPNRNELGDATGLPCETDAEAGEAATVAQASCAASILLTRSEKGMSLFPVGDMPIHLPTVAQDVFDVSGAGDTVVALLAASLAARLPIIDGMRMANHAAGIVVSKIGTASVTREELHASLLAENVADSCDGKLLDLEGAIALREAWARERLTVGFANGCFDLLHPGHISLIRQAAQNCDRLIMALNTDTSVARLKGPGRPVQTEQARAEVMGSVKGVAAVILFEEDTPFELIKALRPDVLVKGADYTIDRVVGADIVQSRGGRVLLADLTAGHSTTTLIQATTEAAKDKSQSHRPSRITQTIA